MGRLQHPNVVHILDAVSEVDEPPYLVMEFVPGSTLRKFCRADALLPLDQIVEIGFKCAMALDYMFRQGLIHRDVKPANLLATLDGDHVVDVKITDFGSVFNLDADRTQIYRVGSLAYMSPEQLDGDTLDCRADIYSLAAVLYHLIAGRPPFDAVQQAAIMHQIYTATPPPLQGLRDGVSPALEALILRALSKNRDDRPANWEEFAQALSALVANRDVPRGAAAGRARLRALQPAAQARVLHRLRRRRAVGSGAPREVAALQLRPCAVPQGRGGQQLPHHRASARSTCTATASVWRSSAPGNSVGEMAYLAPSPDLRVHSADILVSDPLTCISFTPDTLQQLSINTRHLFDNAFIRVLVRRLHAAHEALAHPRRIL